MKGQVYKSLSGFYYIFANGKTYQTRARGIFRNQKLKPQVGDVVAFESENEKEGVLEKIYERKNTLVRPNIANVDQAILVMSMKEPDFSYALLDRFLLVLEKMDISPILFLTKIDLLETAQFQWVEEIRAVYEKIGYPVIANVDKEVARGQLYQHFAKKTSVFMGQTGAGKSTLLNELLPELNLTTGEISNALGRGRHTTRHVELHPMFDGLVADTPGFSSLELLEIDKEALPELFPEFLSASVNCKFRACTHTHEPDCEVKRLVGLGEIFPTRYENYLQFRLEIEGVKPIYQKKKKGEQKGVKK